MKNGWYAFGLLLAACVGAAGKQYVIPPAAAGAGVQKWDYICRDDTRRASAIEKFGKEAGAQGWELVGGRGTTWCFKRPM